MQEFFDNIIETGIGYIPEFDMKEIILYAAALVICLIFAMFGYKLLRMFVALFSLLIGAFAGLALADFLKLDDTFHLVMLLVGAVIFALLGSFVYKLGIFAIVASSIFASAMAVLATFVTNEYLVPASLAASLLIGIFAAFFERPIVIVVSSVAGGIMFANTLTELILSKIKALDPSGVTSAAVLVVGGIIAIFGMYWQFTHTSKE